MSIITEPHLGESRAMPAWRRVLRAISAAMSVQADFDRLQAETRRLQALSDAELAAKGLRRDLITQHVYREIYDL